MQVINYVLRSIWTSKNRSFLFVAAFVTIFVVVPISILTIMEVQVKIDGEITEHARGSYDLLVRPEGARSEVEQQLGLVAENYLGVGEGGITLEAWREIKELPNIEVAAPIASLGYFNGGDKTIELSLPEESSWVGVNYQTTDGIQSFPLPIEEAYYLFEQEGFYYGFELIKNASDKYPAAGHPPLFSFPITSHLTVGVDWQEEQKLTGFDLSKLDEDISDRVKMFGFTEEDSSRHIPVIYLHDAHVPINLSISTAQFPWTTEDTIAYKEELGFRPEEALNIDQPAAYENFSEQLKLSKVTTKDIDLSMHVNPFYNHQLLVDYEGNVQESTSIYNNILSTSSFYQVSPIEYEISDEGLIVKKVNEDLGIPSYREIALQNSEIDDFDSIPFLLHPIASFTTKDSQQTIAASPLGIYQQAPTLLTDGTVVQETILPGSFVSAPAHGLMNIEDAAFIKGESPIDAIRIRISGISGYSQEAEKLILKVAEQIHELGNFEIDFVAGASAKSMTLFVEGLGEVSQPWTSLGAASRIVDGWSATNFIIALLFILVSVFSILNRFLFRRQLRVEESQLLLELGWQKKYVRRFYLLENSLLTVVSFAIASLILAMLLWTDFVEKGVFYLLVISFFVAMVLLTVDSYLKNRSLDVGGSIFKGKSIFLRNIFYYKRFLILTFLQLMLVTMLTLFVTFSILTTVELTGDTNLGNYVNQTVIVSLLMIVGASLLLAVITVSESISSFLILRKDETKTLGDIGWRNQDVLKLYVKEYFSWSAVAILLGAIIGLGITGIYHGLTVLYPSVVIGILVLLLGMVILLSYRITKRHLTMVG